jgi:predicted DNA-binding transcriptional regulator AlpA
VPANGDQRRSTLTRPAAPLPSDLAAALRQLANRLDQLAPAQVVGELEALRVLAFQEAIRPPVQTPAPSNGLAVTAVMQRTGMSKDWLYREARAGRLPFARRHGRRVVFDEAGLTRWLERRGVHRTG